MSDTYAYCPSCDKIAEAIIEKPRHCITPSTPGNWATGDIVCKECRFIIATLFENRDEVDAHPCCVCGRRSGEDRAVCPYCLGTNVPSKLSLFEELSS